MSPGPAHTLAGQELSNTPERTREGLDHPTSFGSSHLKNFFLRPQLEVFEIVHWSRERQIGERQDGYTLQFLLYFPRQRTERLESEHPEDRRNRLEIESRAGVSCMGVLTDFRGDALDAEGARWLRRHVEESKGCQAYPLLGSILEDQR